MSSTAFVLGVVPADKRYKEMLDIQTMCLSAGVTIPKEVSDFFGGAPRPSETGHNVPLGILGSDNVDHVCASHYSDALASGIEIDVGKLPGNIKFIRFLRS